MNRYFFLFIISAFFFNCRSTVNTEPFSEIHSLPEFAPLTDSIRKESQRDDLYFRRAVLLNTKNYPEASLADFRKAWSLNKQESYALGLATLLMDKRPDSAILFLGNALKALPNSLLLHLSLARAYDAKGNMDQALTILDKLLKEEPDQADLIKMKADLLGRKGQTAEAVLLLEKAYSLTPFDVELNYELALKYAETKNPKLVRLCDSLIGQDTDPSNLHAEPHYFKGMYYSNINEKDKAITHFDDAIQRNYYYLNAYIEKGRVLFDQKKIAQALSTFNLALTISPKFPDAYFWIARCQEALGEKDNAKLNYQRAYSLDPTFIEAKEAADKMQ